MPATGVTGPTTRQVGRGSFCRRASAPVRLAWLATAGATRVEDDAGWCRERGWGYAALGLVGPLLLTPGGPALMIFLR